MKRTIVLALLVSLALALSLAVASAASASPPVRLYKGVWRSIDPFDGSQQMMVITPGGGKTADYRAIAWDYGASACGVDDQGHILYAALVLGAGNVEPDGLHMQSDVWCLGHPRWYWGQIATACSYDPVTDTLVDNVGAVWTRVGGR